MQKFVKDKKHEGERAIERARERESERERERQRERARESSRGRESEAVRCSYVPNYFENPPCAKNLCGMGVRRASVEG